MDRRKFVAAISTWLSALAAGCSGDGATETESPTDSATLTRTEASEDENTESTDRQTETETETKSGPQADAVLSYEVTEGSDWGGELPDMYSDWMKWIVVSFDVEQGEISMEDLWFRSRIDTGERYQPADAQSDSLENGIESRGSIIEDGSGDVLYKAPSFADSYTWNLSGLRRQTVAGENIQLDEPGEEFYSDVTVSADIEVTRDSDIITSEAEEYREDDEYWGIVKLDVVEGTLNVEDVWFRSALEAGSRRKSIDYGANRSIKRGMRSRGEIKEGYSGIALYVLSEEPEDVSWYTDEMRQSITLD